MAFTTNQLVQATGTATVKSIANSDVISLLGLDSSVKYKGEWLSGSNYAVNDLIYNGSAFYLCIVSITNSTTNPSGDTTHFKVVGGSTNINLAQITQSGAQPDQTIAWNDGLQQWAPTNIADTNALHILANLSDVADVPTARTNLGLGTAAVADVSAFDAAGAAASAQSAAEANAAASSCQRASNLSDLVSASAARTNLGLGDAATKSVGTTAGTVAAGNDSRFSPSQIAKNSGYVSTDGYVLAHDSFGNEVLLFGALRTSCDILAGGRNNADGSQRVFCSGVGLIPVAASSVANGVLFADSSNSNKLSFKDSGGTVHALY